VPSPTYTLVQNYQIIRQSNTVEIWHYDLYRTSAEDEVIELGIEDAFSEGIVLIEWPENAIKLLPKKRLEIHFEFSTYLEERIITLRGPEKWQHLNIKNSEGVSA
jgi:tRNA threonylcarbamoyladenosine biosynthesis protein TsaE